MKKVYKRLLAIILSITVMLCFCVTLSADIGPKPSIHISFLNMPEVECYGTLLSKRDSTGPSSVWDGNPEYARHNEREGYEWAAFDYATWLKFVEYKDSDGFYFLQEGWDVIESDGIHWTYYPPQEFKILLYFPQYDSFVTSGIYERYAFDTYYTVDMSGVDIMQISVMSSVELDEENSTDDRYNEWYENEWVTVYQEQEAEGITTPAEAYGEPIDTQLDNSIIVAVPSYDYLSEILSLVIRIALTIIIELVIALIFGFMGTKQFWILLITNGITQIILNIILAISDYTMGFMAFSVFYVLLEILVFIIEAVVYCTILKSYSDKPKKSWYYILYALVANCASFGLGMWLARYLPEIF